MEDQGKSKDQLIHELVELRQRIARSEERYHALFEQSNDAVFILDLQGDLLDANQRATNMLGYPQEELLDLSFFEIATSADHTRNENILQTLLDGERIAPYERIFRQKDGREFPVEVNVELVHDEAGNPLHIQSMVRDISDRQEVEESLEKQRELLRQIIDHNPNVVIVKDRQGRFVVANRAAEREFGKSADDLLGKTDLELHPVREEAEAFMRDDQQALESLETRFIPEEPVTYANGELRWHQAAKIPFVTSDGERYVMAVGADITERKEAERQRTEMAVQQERIQLLEELIADLSHDIKTPLTSIISFLYLLRKNPDRDKRQGYLNRLEAQVERLATLLDDILTMSRLDKGSPPTFAPFDLNGLIRNLHTQYYHMLDEKDLALHFDLNTDLPHIFGDESELTRALANLLVNAINYTPAGGSITVRTYRQGSDLGLDIHDTGIGIDAEDLSRIFDRFYRADAARNTNQGGTGLGLAIAKKIIELHSGAIVAQSSPGAGSLFRIQLPVTQPGN